MQGTRREAEVGGHHMGITLDSVNFRISWKLQAEREHQKLLQDMEKLSCCLSLSEMARTAVHTVFSLRTRPSTAEHGQGRWKTGQRRGLFAFCGVFLNHAATLALCPLVLAVALGMSSWCRQSGSMHLSSATCNSSKLTETNCRHESWELQITEVMYCNYCNYYRLYIFVHRRLYTIQVQLVTIKTDKDTSRLKSSHRRSRGWWAFASVACKADQAAEKRAREEAEKSYKTCSLCSWFSVLSSSTVSKLPFLLATIQAEKKHAEVLQDRDKIAADMRQLQSDKDARQTHWAQ